MIVLRHSSGSSIELSESGVRVSGRVFVVEPERTTLMSPNQALFWIAYALVTTLGLSWLLGPEWGLALAVGFAVVLGWGVWQNRNKE